MDGGSLFIYKTIDMRETKRLKPVQGSMISRLNKVFIIQLIIISIATVVGVIGAAKVVEDVLIKEALIGEADFYWDKREKFVEFPLPKTMNLTGYLVKDGDYSLVPNVLQNVEEQYQRIELNGSHPIVFVTEKGDEKLYLIFEEAQVARLALYFGITPLIIVLLIIYLPAFISFVFSKRAFSPVLNLVQRLDEAKITKKGYIKLNFDDIKQMGNSDVNVLIDAFEDFSLRITELIHRERNFSRYASHELRTPLTVLRGSLELMKRQELPPKAQKLVARMYPMVEEMQALIEALLLLSRDEVVERSEEPILINDLLKSTVEDTIRLFDPRDIRLEWRPNHLIQKQLPEQLFTIVISNLVRNAIIYSEDPVKLKVTITGRDIVIQDNGKGMTPEQVSRIMEPFYRADEHGKAKGFGLGLSIVDMICKQCDWKIKFESGIEIGTKVTLSLNDVEILASAKQIEL